jgi:hypothetical protein
MAAVQLDPSALITNNNNKNNNGNITEFTPYVYLTVLSPNTVEMNLLNLNISVTLARLQLKFPDDGRGPKHVAANSV